MIRNLRRTVSVAAFLLVAILASVQVVSARSLNDTLGNPQCPNGGNYVSTACLLVGNMTNVYGEWHSNNMTVDYTLEGQGMHVNHTLWMYSSSPCTSFVELGVTRGFLGEHAYRFYYGYANQSNGIAYAFGSDYTAADGVNHSYWVRYDGGQQFSLLRDGYVIPGGVFGAAEGQGFGGCRAAAGLEISKVTAPVDSRFHSDTFDLTNLKYSVSSGWYWWPPDSSWIDWPCGHAQNPPYCLNGIYQGQSYWQDNKP